MSRNSQVVGGSVTWAKFVPDPWVETYFALGWFMASDPLMFDGGGQHHDAWLMIWPCQCPVPKPTQRIR